MGHFELPQSVSKPARAAVWVQTPKEVLLLVTNQKEMTAALVAQLYRQRWQVELFFRWIKCVLGCRHWLAESPEGVALQIYLGSSRRCYCQLHSGARPNRDKPFFTQV